MNKRSMIICLAFALCWPAIAWAQAASALFVLDGSGSMWGKVEGRPKIEVARSVMSDMLMKLPADVQIGLIVYGHNRKDDCRDIEVVAPLGSNRKALNQRLRDVYPKGKTPLTEAVRVAAAQFREHEGSASVVVVSDGKETCEGDPCAAAREATGAGVNLRIHVVGFDVTLEEREQLTCIAEEGKGKYFAAANAEQLVTALAEVEKEVVAPAPPPEHKAMPKSASEVLFEDHFDRDALGEMWEVLNPDPNRLALASGGLVTVATTRPENSLTPRNLALSQKTFSEDFVASVKMTVPATVGIFTGLYYWIDDKSFLSLGLWGLQVASYGSIGYGQDWPAWRHPIFTKTLSGEKEKSLLRQDKKNVFILRAKELGKRKLTGEPKDPETWYLQLERTGIRYTGRISTDGVQWTDIGTHVVVQKNGRLGLGAYQDWEDGNEQPAEFDDFVVKGMK